eukprot:c21944_g1_i1 orf=271-1680(+)
MSIVCGVPVLECVYVLACARWAWKRCVHSGSEDSERWGLAAAGDFEPVPRMCRLVLAVYEEDLNQPQWAPPGGYRINPNGLVKRVGYDETGGRAPPYIIYVDHCAEDIVLAIRGLNLGRESDYAVLLNNKLGQEMFDGGFVHHGLLKAAGWLLNKESETLKDLVMRYPSYAVTFAGHSLGSGVAAMLTMVVAKNRDKLGNISRERLRCFAIAPARCMSLNLAIRYADIIKSVTLQDDFLPRTATPLEDIFKCIFCLPCLLCVRCMKDTCISEERMLKDPRRLYVPGRLYHIVERKLCRCGRYPPIVKTAVPVDGRFEHIVLSCNATSDHSIVWIERESQKALELMMDTESAMEIPVPQKMVRQETLKEEQMVEHKAALERAVSLRVPHAFSPSYGTFESNSFETDDEEKSMLLSEEGEVSAASDSGETSGSGEGKTRAKINWEELINKLFEKDDLGKLHLYTDLQNITE